MRLLAKARYTALSDDDVTETADLRYSTGAS